MDTYVRHPAPHRRTSNRRKAKLNILMFVKGCQVGREKGFYLDFGRGWLPRGSHLNLVYSKNLR